jgi:hypothetical protein
VAEPEDSTAESGGREGESGPVVDTGRRKDDSDEPAEHEEAEATPEDAESSDDETGRNNGSTEDADGLDDLSADDDTDDDNADGDADDRPEGHDATETAVDETDSSEGETADDESGNDEGDEDDDASETAQPPLKPVPFIELMAAYRQPATAGGERLPWSWATLSPAERATSAIVLDGFVESYNRTWAISKEQTVPPCWHRHPALAHDLAALAWAYYQAYRDPMATPNRALQFQADLIRFAEARRRRDHGSLKRILHRGHRCRDSPRGGDVRIRAADSGDYRLRPVRKSSLQDRALGHDAIGHDRSWRAGCLDRRRRRRGRGRGG